MRHAIRSLDSKGYNIFIETIDKIKGLTYLNIPLIFSKIYGVFVWLLSFPLFIFNFLLF